LILRHLPFSKFSGGRDPDESAVPAVFVPGVFDAISAFPAPLDNGRKESPAIGLNPGSVAWTSGNA
jgi:hypothetical protein